MNFLSKGGLVAGILLWPAGVFAQGEIPVDLYTGTPSITIPVHTISALDISQPVVLSYNANAAEQASVFGSGWTLQAGGTISREVRGLPDDFRKSEVGNERTGWLYNFNFESVASEIGFFIPQSDPESGTYGTRPAGELPTGEIYDYEKLSSYGDKIDTEPDVFSFSFNGVSGKFVFDHTRTIRTIPYMDLKIEPTYTSETNKKIISFKITTNDGYTYTFSYRFRETKKVSKPSEAGTLPIMDTQYQLYKETIGYYTYLWALTEMRSPAGNWIKYEYTGGTSETTDPEPPEVTTGRNFMATMFHQDDLLVEGNYDYMSTSVFSTVGGTGAIQPLVPSKIESSTGERMYCNASEIMIADSRKSATPGEDIVKSFRLSYIDVDYLIYSGSSNPVAYTRKFLRTLQEGTGCDRYRPYVFEYDAEPPAYEDGHWTIAMNYITEAEWHLSQTFAANNLGVIYPYMYIYPDKPMEHRYQRTAISGYPGTSYYLEGIPKPTEFVRGILRSIEYPAGGRTTLLYQQHSYWNESTNRNESATGARISWIEYFDGTGRPPVNKYFNYQDETGKSTGRIFRKPVTHIPAFRWQDPYYPASADAAHRKSYSELSEADRWKYLTIRTEWDIAPSDADNVVGYTRVKVIREGSGYAIHEFDVPGVYGETSNGEWQTPETVFARRSTTPTSTIASVNMAQTIFPSGGTWRYPNAPNPFYDYARGLPKKVTSYSATGKLVKKVVTTYQDLYKTGSQATKVYGICYDRMPLSGNDVYLLSRYFLLTDAAKVPKADTVTLYDANEPGSTKYTTETTEYFYGSANHKLVTEVKRMAADGNVYRTKFKYPKDYANQASGEAAVTALNTLVSDFRHGAPVETVSTLRKGSDPEMVLGANLVKYKSFGNPMPESSWALELDAPLAAGSFTNSSIINSSGYTLSIDSRYKMTSAVLSYAMGMPTRTANRIARDTSEVALGFGNSLPVVRVSGGDYTKVAFSDFEDETLFSFNNSSEIGIHPPPYFSKGRSGKRAFYPCIALRSKAVKRVDANTYVVGFWLKSNNPTGFTLKLTGINPPYTAIHTQSFTEPPTNSEFKYIQKTIPMGSIAPGEKLFRMELTTTTGLPIPPATGYTNDLLPVIDDVFFFPEGVQLESYDYQVPFGVSSVTTGTGQASHITYDGIGREKLVRDRDLNIVKRNSYSLFNDDPLFAEISTQPIAYENVPVGLVAPEFECVGTVTYEWDTGSGYVTGDRWIEHTYTTSGINTVRLRVSSPGYPTKTGSVTIEVRPVPISGQLCARGTSELNGTTYTNGYTCSSIAVTPPQGQTTFRAINLVACGDSCEFTWYLKDAGSVSNPYNEVQVGGTEYTSGKVVPGGSGFLVMCKIRKGTEEFFTEPLGVFVN